GRRHVHYSGSVGGCNEVTGDDIPGFLVDGEEAEPTFVFFTGQFTATHRMYDFDGVFMNDGEPFFRQDQKFVFVANLDVFDVRTYRKADIRDEGPRSRGPDQEVGVVFSFDLRLYIDRGILSVPVSE